jgi:hypothetical protein
MALYHAGPSPDGNSATRVCRNPTAKNSILGLQKIPRSAV